MSEPDPASRWGQPFRAVDTDVTTFALSNGKARPDRTAIAEWPALAALRQVLNCPARATDSS